MPKVKYDVTGVESGGDVPPAALYSVAITDCQYGESKGGNDMFTVELTIKGGAFDGRKLWTYILPKQTESRMRQFVDALQLKDAGQIDTDAIVGTVIQVKTKIEKSDEYGEQARVTMLMPGGDAESETEAPYSEWEVSELSEEIEARELTIAGRKTKAKMVTALEEDDAAAEGGEITEADEEAEDEESEEEEAEEGITAAEIRMLSRTDLKAMIKDEELDIKVLKSMSDEDLAEAIIAALGLEDEEEEEEEADEEEEEDDEEGDDEEGEAVDYSTWEIADLKSELKERGLKPDGKKALLVKRLEADDASGEEPF